MADALGMGLDITEPTGVMIVDIGADTTEISVISLGGLVLSNLLPFGGNQLDDDIVTYLKRNHSLVIGRKTAKQLKEHIGSARMPQQEQTMKWWAGYCQRSSHRDGDQLFHDLRGYQG